MASCKNDFLCTLPSGNKSGCSQSLSFVEVSWLFWWRLWWEILSRNKPIQCKRRVPSTLVSQLFLTLRVCGRNPIVWPFKCKIMPFLALFFFWAWFYMSFRNFVRFLMGKGPKGITNLEMQIVNFHSRNYIFISLLASSPFMASEASHGRTREQEGWRKGEFSIISHKLSFLLRSDEAKY